MPRKRIQPSDISIPNSGPIMIGGGSDEYLIVNGLGGPVIFHKDGDAVWPLDEEQSGRYTGWEDDAKKAIADHNNAKIS